MPTPADSVPCRDVASRYERVQYLGCGSGSLLLTVDGSLNGRLITDGVHPSPSGYEKLFVECWNPFIMGILNGTAAA